VPPLPQFGDHAYPDMRSKTLEQRSLDKAGCAHHRPRRDRRHLGEGNCNLVSMRTQGPGSRRSKRFFLRPSDCIYITILASFCGKII
jgi:hypothetical protein